MTLTFSSGYHEQQNKPGLNRQKRRPRRKLLNFVLKWRLNIKGRWPRAVQTQTLEEETDGKIHHLKAEASRISPDVVSMLLRHVTTVKN
ncbi:V-type proton ATPase subunit G 1-like isoform X2 [Salvia divinorum]|uniref:V-type proton ATPase subunit G 1-like isoform X2 n=1 Tax=Salvia divinorum TaxID=28513 RepID=A0ABD1HB50_SALDI